MDFSKYESKLTHPVRSDFTTTYWYDRGTCVATLFSSSMRDAAEIREKYKSYPSQKLFDEGAYSQAVKAYWEDKSKLHEQFKHDLFEELGISNHPKKERFFAKVQELCDSSYAYEDIYKEACDLVDLIR